MGWVVRSETHPYAACCSLAARSTNSRASGLVGRERGAFGRERAGERLLAADRSAASISVRSSTSRWAWLPPKRWAMLRTGAQQPHGLGIVAVAERLDGQRDRMADLARERRVVAVAAHRRSWASSTRRAELRRPAPTKAIIAWASLKA